MIEFQPNAIYNRRTKEYYAFSLPASEFADKINKGFNVKYTLTKEDIKNYG